MHQTCMYGSERGARGNLRSYRDRGPRGPDCVRRSTGRVRPAVFYRSKFEVSAALLQLCLCTACQVGPDHEVMKRPDCVEIGEAQGIVGMHNGCRDEQRAYWRMASEQR